MSIPTRFRASPKRSRRFEFGRDFRHSTGFYLTHFRKSDCNPDRFLSFLD